MFKCLIVLIAAATILYQPVDASSKDDAKKAFHKLMEVIDKALTDAQKTLDKALQQFEAASQKAEAQINGELDKQLAPLRKKLDELVKKAQDKGFDVKKCQKYVDDFSQTPDHLTHNLLDCINKQIAKAKGFIDDALKNIKQMEQDLNGIDAEIDKCDGNKWSKAKCYAKILEKIYKDTKEAPEKIVNDVGKTVQLISTLLPTVEACMLEKLKDAGEDAAKDVGDFAICAAV